MKIGEGGHNVRDIAGGEDEENVVDFVTTPGGKSKFTQTTLLT